LRFETVLSQQIGIIGISSRISIILSAIHSTTRKGKCRVHDRGVAVFDFYFLILRSIPGRTPNAAQLSRLDGRRWKIMKGGHGFTRIFTDFIRVPVSELMKTMQH
jgi:hypothetical protein